MIESPPHVNQKLLTKALKHFSNSEVVPLIQKYNDSYLYWSDIKYKPMPKGVTPEELWACLKTGRMLQQNFQWEKYHIHLSSTNYIQHVCHELDMNFGGSWGNQSLISNESKEQYLISSLMEEAISSSQIEGAATTRKVAKEMLRKEILPRSRSEQMILNNYNSIRFIVDHKDDELTSELLLHVHALMTAKTLEHSEDEGRYRIDDNVVVENNITHEVVHTPPSYQNIPAFIDDLCTFFNQKSDSDGSSLIHPIVRAIIVHFLIAYVHPFVDGNGRTARALFYWYMLKQGYRLTEYLSISRIIQRSKASYEKAYLYTEADDNDVTYFVIYHLRVLNIAFKELQLYIKRKTEQRQQSADFMRLGYINERQAAILSLIKNDPKIIFTIKELQNRFAITHPTAKRDVDELVAKGLLERIPVNNVKSNYVKGKQFDKQIQSIK